MRALNFSLLIFLFFVTSVFMVSACHDPYYYTVEKPYYNLSFKKLTTEFRLGINESYTKFKANRVYCMDENMTKKWGLKYILPFLKINKTSAFYVNVFDMACTRINYSNSSIVMNFNFGPIYKNCSYIKIELKIKKGKCVDFNISNSTITAVCDNYTLYRMYSDDNLSLVGNKLYITIYNGTNSSLLFYFNETLNESNESNETYINESENVTNETSNETTESTGGKPLLSSGGGGGGGFYVPNAHWFYQNPQPENKSNKTEFHQETETNKINLDVPLILFILFFIYLICRGLV